jgi:hypothetical protein
MGISIDTLVLKVGDEDIDPICTVDKLCSVLKIRFRKIYFFFP